MERTRQIQGAVVPPAGPAWMSHIPPRMLRIHEVTLLTGLSRASVYRLAAEGKFPAGVKLSLRSTAWPGQAVAAWLQQRIEASAGETQ